MERQRAVEHQLDHAELAIFENSSCGQAQFLDQLRAGACAEQRPALLTDPSGRVLACAGFDGVVHQLASVVLEALAPEELLCPVIKDEPENIGDAPSPGFYASMRRTFYVTSRHRVFVVRDPELGLVLQPTYGLPDEAEELDVDELELELLVLRTAAEEIGSNLAS